MHPSEEDVLKDARDDGPEEQGGVVGPFGRAPEELDRWAVEGSERGDDDLAAAFGEGGRGEG